MGASKVYFTNMRTSSQYSLLDKLEKLVVEAGMLNIDFKRQFAAIKLHFGEPGNLSYLRPNYTKVIVDLVKKAGGQAFVTDCNTLYVGRRKNAIDHMDAAYENGYNPFATGCHVIIGDGLKGTDEVLVPVEGGTYVKEAKIGRAIMDADVFISLTHFKCHELTGIGGAIKNIGMGCGSRAGKMEMHSAGKPCVTVEDCISCGRCAKNCAHSAISFKEKKASINHDICVGCGRCIGVCPADAIQPASDEAHDILDMKMAEYTQAVLKDRPHFHISLIIDVSPFCDCHNENDAAVVPDIGMLASFDPVALDKACADLVNAAEPLENSRLSEQKAKGEGAGRDHFAAVHPVTDWEIALTHGEKLGIGTKNYELITLDLA